MMTEGCRSGLLGFIPSSFAVCKETFASCHKRLRPCFYGVHTQRGMSSHSCCLDGAATGHGLISSFCPPFVLRVSELGWQVTSVQLQDLQRTSANIVFFLQLYIELSFFLYFLIEHFVVVLLFIFYKNMYLFIIFNNYFFF